MASTHHTTNTAPLAHKVALVTRAHNQSHSLVEGLKALGAEVFQLPVITIEALDDSPHIAACWQQRNRLNGIILTSANAVTQWFAQLTPSQREELRQDNHVQWLCVGQATADALMKHGYTPDWQPSRAKASTLAMEWLTQNDVRGHIYWFPCSQQAQTLLELSFIEAGAWLECFPLYRPVAEAFDAEMIEEALRRGALHLLTFASPSAARFFLERLPLATWEQAPTPPVWAAIGPTTAKELERHGVCVDIVPQRPGVASWLEAIAQYYAHQREENP